MMSFSSDVRAETAREVVMDPCCARAEFAGALLACGGVSFHGAGRYSLALTATDAVVIRHFFSLLKHFFNISCQIRTLRTNQLRGATRYQLAVPDEAAGCLMDACGLWDPKALFGVRAIPKAEIMHYSCCKKAFLRGAFQLCGAVSNPEKSYHLEFAAPNEILADFVIELMEYFEIFAKKACRKSKFVVYLKGGESISDMLALLGAQNSVMSMENVRVKKEVHNRVNRQINCDESNLNRLMLKAEAQVRDIRLIQEEIGLEKLPRSLREMAILRLENPDKSLAALGELASPALGKSGVNSRMRRIAEIAAKLRTGEDIQG